MSVIPKLHQHWLEHSEQVSLLTNCQSLVPKPPVGPLNVRDQMDGSVILRWQAPANDGWMLLREYFVEKQKVGTVVWQRNEETIHPDTPTCRVRLLEEDQLYRFRVIAQYDRGKSEPWKQQNQSRLELRTTSARSPI